MVSTQVFQLRWMYSRCVEVVAVIQREFTPACHFEFWRNLGGKIQARTRILAHELTSNRSLCPLRMPRQCRRNYSPAQPVLQGLHRLASCEPLSPPSPHHTPHPITPPVCQATVLHEWYPSWNMFILLTPTRRIRSVRGGRRLDERHHRHNAPRHSQGDCPSISR